MGKDKKGIMSFNFLSLIPRIMFLVIMLIACVILIRMFITNKFHTQDVQAEVLVAGFMYGAGGVNYYDPVTGRIYPQVIDINQFDGAELDSAFFFNGDPG